MDEFAEKIFHRSGTLRKKKQEKGKIKSVVTCKPNVSFHKEVYCNNLLKHPLSLRSSVALKATLSCPRTQVDLSNREINTSLAT